MRPSEPFYPHMVTNAQLRAECKRAFTNGFLYACTLAGMAVCILSHFIVWK